MTFEEPGLPVGFFEWSPDGTRIYFPDGLDGDHRSGIWSITTEGGGADQVLSLDGRRLGFGQIAVGEDYVYYPIREIETDIWALELTED